VDAVTSGPAGERQAAPRSRRVIRITTATLAALASALYVVVFLVQLPHLREPDNPAPVYAALAVVYATGAVLGWWDRRVLHWVGAAVQAVLLGLFFWILAELYGHGEESFILDMLWLAVAITALQVVLLVLLVRLALTARRSPREAS